MKSFKQLPTVKLDGVATIERPAQGSALSGNSPALEVFADFHKRPPTLLEGSTPVGEAIELMRRTHEKFKLVIDAGESFRGVITLADLLSVKVMKASLSTGLQHSELTVADVMIPRSALRAVDYRELCAARVGDLLATMRNFGDRFIMVVDGDRRSLRGLVSSSEIAQGLQVPIAIGERANSFSDIYQAVRA